MEIYSKIRLGVLEVNNMSEWKSLGRVDDISKGEMRRYEIDQIRILVARLDDGFFAIQDECPHMRVSLSYGSLKDDIITCSLHKSEVNVRTGKVVKKPHISKILNVSKMGKLMTDIIVKDTKTYQLKTENDEIYVQI